LQGIISGISAKACSFAFVQQWVTLFHCSGTLRSQQDLSSDAQYPFPDNFQVALNTLNYCLRICPFRAGRSEL